MDSANYLDHTFQEEAMLELLDRLLFYTVQLPAESLMIDLPLTRIPTQTGKGYGSYSDLVVIRRMKQKANQSQSSQSPTPE
jgi:hypothetical protein